MPESLLSPFTDQILAALQYQGMREDCGPFTTATVINALLGTNLDAIQLAEEMNRPVWRGPIYVVRRIPNWATFPWGMVDVFREKDLQADWRPLASIDYLKQSLQSQKVLMPIIGEWKPLWAHVMSLVAWETEKGWGFANTQFSHHNIDWHSDEEFRHQWKAMGHLLVEVKAL